MNPLAYLDEMRAILKEKGHESPHYLLGYLAGSMSETQLKKIVKELRDL